MGRRILAAWLPNWPVQRLLCKRPELRGRPLVLKHRTVRGECAAACSDAARARGAEVGMPIAEVRALLGSTPAEAGSPSAWVQEDHDAAADREALVRLAQWCHRFSPTVGMEDAETLLLDATNLAPLFGGESQWVEQVEQGLARLGLTAKMALADNVATAWAAAHYGRGVVELLPIAALRLPQDIAQTLLRLGVATIGDVLALPRDQLRPRFGDVLLKRIDQALGRVEEAIVAVPLRPELAVSEQLDHPLAKREHVEQVVGQLIERVVHLLKTHNAGALQLRCRFECENADAATLAAGLFRPSADAVHLTEIVGMQLERLLLPAAVTAVEVSVVQHAPLARRQQRLFEAENSLESSVQLAALVDRLAGRLGREAVVRSRLVSDAQPELAYREIPLVDGAKKRTPASRSRASCAAALDRPLQLLDRPARVDALAIADRGPPRQFYYRGSRHDVARHWGPERIETGWWRKRGISRDYYRVETTAGSRFWLYRCLRTRQWFLHGVF